MAPQVTGIQARLREGLGQLVALSGDASWVGAGQVNLASAIPPIFDTQYPDKPDVAAAFSTYVTGGDEPIHADSEYQLQVRTRGTKTDSSRADDLDDAISQVFLGNWPVTLPNGVRVVRIIRTSGSPIGPDAAGRQERTTNWLVRVLDPGPHRL